MYRIVGADGKEYGPVSLEQIGLWIQEGRANAQTQVLPENAAEWRKLGDLPEFAGSLAAAIAPLSAPQAFPVSVPPRRTHPLATAGLILGVLALTIGFCCYGIPFNLVGLVLSLVAWVQIRNQTNIYNGRGIAIAGIVLNTLSLLIAMGLMVRLAPMSF